MLLINSQQHTDGVQVCWQCYDDVNDVESTDTHLHTYTHTHTQNQAYNEQRQTYKRISTHTHTHTHTYTHTHTHTQRKKTTLKKKNKTDTHTHTPTSISGFNIKKTIKHILSVTYIYPLPPYIELTRIPPCRKQNIRKRTVIHKLH